MDLFTNLGDPHLPFKISEGINFSYVWDDKKKIFIVKIPDGELIFSATFINKKISDRSVEYFQENDTYDDWKTKVWKDVDEEDFKKIVFRNIKWKKDEINLFGKKIPLPRLTSWHGDSGKSYTYSGITSQPNEWNEGLLYIKKQVEKLSSANFNSVLMNWYRDGEDHLNWHADDEPDLGVNPVIASVNFGETRDFVIRRNDDPKKKITIPLSHGSVLIMRGEIQSYWQHSVPKRKGVKGSRFNLTFRNIG